MIKYLGKRLVSGLISLFLFVSLLFVLAKILIPGDYVTQFQFVLSPAERAALREGLGFNQSLWQQYWRFVVALLSGNLGESGFGPPIWDLVWFGLRITLIVFVPGMGLAYYIGQWLGRFAAWDRGRLLPSAIGLGSVFMYTVFPVLLAFLMMVAFRSAFGWSEFVEMRTREVITVDHSKMLLATLSVVVAAIVGYSSVRSRVGQQALPISVGLFLCMVGCLALWTALGVRDEAVDMMYAFSLPILAVALLSFGEITLIVRSSMSNVSSEEFVRTARAKGLPERMIRDRHASRVALLPTISKLVVSVPVFLAGLVIVELAFTQSEASGLFVQVPGLSRMLFGSLEDRNIPLVVGGLFAVGLISLLLRLGLDVWLAVLDPRIRYSDQSPP